MAIVRRFAKPVWAIVVWSVILAVLIGSVTNQIANAYLDNHSYFFDPVSYSFQNACLYVRLADEERLSLAAQEWLGNARHPLRTVPLLLFVPGLLASRMGHMATALPMLGAFLTLLGWTVYRRTRYLPYAIGSMALFCAIPGMFSPTTGLGAYWLDLPAAFLVGGAALCLLNSSSARDLRWLAGFAVLSSLAALSRYVAAMYVFVTCVPVLAYYFIQRWRQEGNVVKTVLLPLGVIGIVIGILAGYFLIAHFESNVQFYSIKGYALGHGILSSAGSVIRSVGGFFSIPGTTVLGAIGLVNLAMFWKHTEQDWKNLVISIWFASAVILYLVLSVRVVGAGHATLYAVPLIFLAIISPAPIGKKQSGHRWLRPLTSVVIFLALLLGGYGTLTNHRWATHPSPDAQAQKALDVALTEALHEEGGSLVWNAYFDEYAWIPTMETFYRYGEFPLSAGQAYFTVHETQWLGYYPNLSPGEVSERVYAATSRWVDVAVVFDDPKRADTNTRMTNPYSRSVARYVAERIRNDASWMRVFALETQRYGTLAGYRNLASQGRGYRPLLTGDSEVRP